MIDCLLHLDSSSKSIRFFKIAFVYFQSKEVLAYPGFVGLLNTELGLKCFHHSA